MTRKTSIQSAMLVVLLTTAAVLLYRNGNSTKASESDVKTGGSYKPMSVDNPQIHWDRLTDSQEAEYKSTGRDIFNWQLPAPPPPVPVHVPQQGDADYIPPPVPPPPPPKLPLKFFGIGTDSKGTARRAFLTDGSEVFIVAEGDTVLGRFRVVKITTVRLEFEEISSGRHASKALEDQTPGG
ncbi:MAG TPA: hypothetical protein VK709_17610 [Candidatus Saccharimonadales bacterium]|jgi:hypothetical protein|nr:hypothetical protein [Candidatus Saccharimonadales bacterium]